MKLGLVSCAKSKQKHPCRAEDMYTPSSLFRKAYKYSKKRYDQVAILSAKYGLLLPQEIIEPYELTLKTMKVSEKRLWAIRVHGQLHEKVGLTRVDSVYFHTGLDYRRYLIPLLKNDGLEVSIPLENLSLGQQLQWYNNECSYYQRDES